MPQTQRSIKPYSLVLVNILKKITEIIVQKSGSKKDELNQVYGALSLLCSYLDDVAGSLLFAE